MKLKNQDGKSLAQTKKNRGGQITNALYRVGGQYRRNM
jgi:hypothetical protein